MEYNQVVVLGAGVTSSGITQLLTTASMDVGMLDVNNEFIEEGLLGIASKFESNIKEGKDEPWDKDRGISRIKRSTQPQDAAGSDW